jgi:hypothetical protein
MGADPLTGADQPAQRVISHPSGDHHPSTRSRPIPLRRAQRVGAAEAPSTAASRRVVDFEVILGVSRRV